MYGLLYRNMCYHVPLLLPFNFAPFQAGNSGVETVTYTYSLCSNSYDLIPLTLNPCLLQIILY
jgi:hypothetical protein